jgi:hypothetical protein
VGTEIIAEIWVQVVDQQRDSPDVVLSVIDADGKRGFAFADQSSGANECVGLSPFNVNLDECRSHVREETVKCDQLDFDVSMLADR